MVRKSGFLIGLGLAIMWWLGLSMDRSATILWFDAVGAIVAFGIAALVDDRGGRPSRALGPAVLGLGLGVLWVAGRALQQPAWANWLNFLFAITALGVAVAAVGARRHLPFQIR